MPLIINKKVIDLSSMVKEAKYIREKVAFLRANYSEDGKHVVFVWDDTKQKKTGLKKFIRGFRQRSTVSPKGVIINLQAQTLMFEGEGLADVVYARRAVSQRQGEALEMPKEKLIFQGRQVVNIDRQPDLAFFLYSCCPLCRDGENSNGSNVFKVEHNENEALKVNEAMRSKLKVQLYALSDETDGGLSMLEIKKIAKDVYKMRSNIGEQQARQNIVNRVTESVAARKEFIKLAEDAILARGKSTTTAKTQVETPAKEVEAEVDESEVMGQTESPQEVEVEEEVGIVEAEVVPDVLLEETETEQEEEESEEEKEEESDEDEQSTTPAPQRKPRATKAEMRQREAAKKRKAARDAQKKAAGKKRIIK